MSVCVKGKCSHGGYYLKGASSEVSVEAFRKVDQEDRPENLAGKGARNFRSA
jgi:hypothetical protein